MFGMVIVLFGGEDDLRWLWQLTVKSPQPRDKHFRWRAVGINYKRFPSRQLGGLDNLN